MISHKKYEATPPHIRNLFNSGSAIPKSSKEVSLHHQLEILPPFYDRVRLDETIVQLSNSLLENSGQISDSTWHPMNRKAGTARQSFERVLLVQPTHEFYDSLPFSPNHPAVAVGKWLSEQQHSIYSAIPDEVCASCRISNQAGYSGGWFQTGEITFSFLEQTIEGPSFHCRWIVAPTANARSEDFLSASTKQPPKMTLAAQFLESNSVP